MGLLDYFKPSKGEAYTNDRRSDVQYPKTETARQEAYTSTASHAPSSPSLHPSLQARSLHPHSLHPTGHGSATHPDSGTASLYTQETRDARSTNSTKCDIMVSWLYQQQMERLWTTGEHDEGVVLKTSRNSYACCPESLNEEPDGFVRAIETLNVRVAMTITTRAIRLFLSRDDRPYVPLKSGLRLHVLPDITFIPRCQKHQFAAFIADRGILVVWDDEPRHILDRGRKIERALMEMIWDDDVDEKAGQTSTTVTDEEVVEKGAIEQPRRISMLMPILSALVLLITIVIVGCGLRRIAMETLVDSNYIRLAFLAAIPAQLWLTLFLFQTLVNSIAQIIGPVSQMQENNKFFSAIKPKPLRRHAGPLPHVTIQMPVDSEDSRDVMEPAIASIKAAISTYEMQGGTANVLTNDDTMQLISADDARARQDFYDEHSIGWVARPPHNPNPQKGEVPFFRRGKCKKASNMNFALWVSNRVEDKLNAIHRHEGWSQEDEAFAYREALAEVVEEDDGRTWADGNIRIGDYILRVDSNTRMPADCLLDCVSEMEQAPRIAILQFATGVMNVTDSFFERGIASFTNLVYSQIRYAAAAGNVPPFAGSNALLRWSTVQEVGYDCADDGREKFWSETTVCKDLDIALRLQEVGYLIRLSAYADDHFQKIASNDELARWEKHAYSCSEFIFHHLHHWPTRGPFTPLLRRFLTSNLPLPSKLSILAHLGLFHALSSLWILTLANYFLAGWFHSPYYLLNFKIYTAIIIATPFLAILALAILQYRIGQKPALLKWSPLLPLLFLTGTSLHLSYATLTHLLGLERSRDKQAEPTTFLRKFKGTFVFCILCVAMMVGMARFAPVMWRIDSVVAIAPLASLVVGHFCLPFVLNLGMVR